MLSYTQISLFEKCPMKWYRQYVLNETEPESPVLKFGSVLHKTIEAFLWGCKLETAISDNEKTLPEDEQNKLGILVNQAVSTVQSTFNVNLYYLIGDPRFKNNGVEEEIIYDNFKGVIDLILSINDKIFVIDWKTTSLDYTDHQIRSSDQLICYSWLLKRVYNIIPDAVFYVTLNKRNDSCKLYSTTVSEDEILCWENKVGAIRKSIDNSLYYKNTNQCVEKWGKCFHYDICWSNKKVNLPALTYVPKFGGK